MMKPVIKTVRNLVSKNASDLLLFGGVGCILGGGVLAIRQTPKAVLILDTKKDERTIDKVKAVAPLFVPTVGLVVVGITQIVCARNITKNKLAAITTAYTISDKAYKTYRDKVKEIVEPEKYENIQREVVRETVDRNPANKENINVSGNKVLIYDSSADRYFEGTLNEIEKAVNTLNKRMRNDMTISLNEFYTEIGLNCTKTGEYLGWNIDKDEIEIYTSSDISEDGRPYILLELMGFTSI